MNHFKEWLPAIGLAFASFIFVSSEFAPVGLLPQIAETIGESEAKTGLIMTVYAWSVAIVSLPLMLLTAKMDRRKLMIILLFMFCVGNLLVGLAETFFTIIAARIVIAFCHAIFWSISMPLAARVSPYGKYSYGLSIVSAGVTFATVLGMPLGKYIGDQMGWHNTFFVISGTAFVIMIIISLIMPSLPSKNAGSLKSLPALFKNKALIAAYAVVILLITGHFTAYTYIVPFLTKITMMSENTTTTVLLLYGAAGIIGILISNKYMEKYMRQLLIGSTVVTVAMLALLLYSDTNFAGIFTVLIIWSISMTVFGLNMNLWILRLAPQATDTAMSMYSGLFNVGIGGGALVGALTINHIELGYIGYVGALFIVPTILLFILFASNKKVTAQK